MHFAFVFSYVPLSVFAFSRGAATCEDNAQFNTVLLVRSANPEEHPTLRSLDGCQMVVKSIPASDPTGSCGICTISTQHRLFDWRTSMIHVDAA